MLCRFCETTVAGCLGIYFWLWCLLHSVFAYFGEGDRVLTYGGLDYSYSLPFYPMELCSSNMVFASCAITESTISSGSLPPYLLLWIFGYCAIAGHVLFSG